MIEALRAADAAGDVDAATRLATAIRSMPPQAAVTTRQDAPTQPAAPPPQPSGMDLFKALLGQHIPSQETVAAMPRKAGNVARALAQGATANYADEGIAKAREMLFSEDYSAALADERARLNELPPVGRTVLELGGGFAVPGGIFAKGVQKLGPLLGGVAAGAGFGGAYASGAAEGGMENRLEEAKSGAMLGALMGPAVQVAGAGARKAHGYLSKDGQDLPFNMLRQSMFGDRMTPGRVDKVAKSLERTGARPITADAGDVNMRRLARDIAEQPGTRYQRDARARLKNRADARGGRLDEAIVRLTGKPTNYYDDTNALMAKAKADAGPMYKAVENEVVEIGPELRKLLNRPSIRQGWSVAKRIAADRGKKIPTKTGIDLALEFGKDGAVSVKEIPRYSTEVKWLDHLKRGIDGVIKRGTDPITGKMTSEASAAVQAKQDLLAHVDEMVPGYADARAVWSGSASAKAAMERGRNFLKQDVEISRQMLDKMSPSDREFFRAGAVRALRDMATSDSGAGITRLRKAFTRDTALKNKIELAFPDEKARREFAHLIKGEERLAASEQYIPSTVGSQTATRETPLWKRLGATGITAHVSPGSSALATYGAIRSSIMKLMQGAQLNSKDYEVLNKALLRPYGPEAQGLLQRAMNTKDTRGIMRAPLLAGTLSAVE